MRLFYLLFVFIFFGCVTKKKVFEKRENIKKDTIKVYVEKTVIKPVIDTIKVDSPCDSLGRLKSFEKVFKTEKTSVKVYNDKGNIKVAINNDSIVNQKTAFIKISDRINSLERLEEKRVSRVNFNMILILVISLAFNYLLITKRLK